MPKFVIAAGAGALGLVLLFGLYVFYLGLRNVWYAAASTGWPKTQGTVVRSETSREVSVDRDTRDESVTWSAGIVVRYRADVMERDTNLIRFGQTFGSGDISEAELQRVRYPAGARVSVSYHPHQPWIACVRPGLHADAFWLIGAGLAFILPVVMSVFAFRAFIDGPNGLARGEDTGMAVAAGIFAAIFCALGVLGLASGLGRIWHGYDSRRWPMAEGEVIFSRVTDSISRDERTGEASRIFSPSFVYRYEVNGLQHYNNLRRFGRIAGSGEDWAADISARYPKGRMVRVRYLPSDPDISALEPGNSSEALWLPGAAAVALVFGVAIFVIVVPRIARPF